MVKLAYEGFGAALAAERVPAAMTLLRYVGMWPLFAIAAWFESRFRLSRGEMRASMLSQFVASGLYMVLFMEGMRLAGPGPAAVMVAVAPLATIVLSVLMRQETAVPKLWVGVGLATVGVTAVGAGSLQDHGGSVWGIGMLLASAVLWGWSVVLAKPVLGQVGPFTMLAVGIPAAMLLVVPYGAGAVAAVDWSGVTALGWLGAGYLAFVAGFAAFWAYYHGLRAVGATQTGLNMYLIPPTAAVFGWWILGDAMGWKEWLGMGLVLVGVWIGRQATAVVVPSPAPES